MKSKYLTRVPHDPLAKICFSKPVYLIAVSGTKTRRNQSIKT